MLRQPGAQQNQLVKDTDHPGKTNLALTHLLFDVRQPLFEKEGRFLDLAAQQGDNPGQFGEGLQAQLRDGRFRRLQSAAHDLIENHMVFRVQRRLRRVADTGVENVECIRRRQPEEVPHGQVDQDVRRQFGRKAPEPLTVQCPSEEPAIGRAVEARVVKIQNP